MKKTSHGGTPAAVRRQIKASGLVYWWTGQVWSDDRDAAKRYPTTEAAQRSADVFRGTHHASGDTFTAVPWSARV